MRSPAVRPAWAVAAFALVVASTVLAQSSSPTSSAQAKAALAQSLSVMTGGTTISDVVLTGTFRWVAGSQQQTGSVTLKALGLSKSRIDLTSSNWNVSEIRSDAAPNTVGQWGDPAGSVHAMGTPNGYTDAVWFFPPLTSLAATNDPGLSAAVVGTESFHGTPAQEYLYWYTDQGAGGDKLSVTALHLSSTATLPLAIDYSAHPDNDASSYIAIEIRYSNYQPVNGILVPFHIQKYVNGDLVLDITITSAVFNTGLSASQFSF